jgi:hypothetical protein
MLSLLEWFSGEDWIFTISANLYFFWVFLDYVSLGDSKDWEVFIIFLLVGCFPESQ